MHREVREVTRQARGIADSGVYHIMLRGNERKNIFQEDEDKQRFLDGVVAKQMETRFSVYAYCLMDNHVHLLMKVNNDDLASIMKGIAVRYASFYNWKYKRVGHVFQDRFKSEAIEDERYLLAAVRYIHYNPIKAGITETVAGYKWSSYPEYLRIKGQSCIETEFVLGIIGGDRRTAIKEFERFSTEQNDLEFIDCEDELMIRTFDEGKAYLTAYLNKNTPGLRIGQIKDDKAMRKEIILHLISETSLSQRMIAELLEVDKGVVERAKAKYNKA